MQADQTIYALYASKRLHKELEGLTDKAVITTDDDVHLTMTFKQGTVVKITSPEIYPNVVVLFLCDMQTFGMLKIDSVEGPRKDIEVGKGVHSNGQSDLREKFFGDITAAVEYIYDTLSKQSCLLIFPIFVISFVACRSVYLKGIDQCVYIPRKSKEKKKLSQTGLNRRPCG